jgi:RHS repeat-associated protein
MKLRQLFGAMVALIGAAMTLMPATIGAQEVRTYFVVDVSGSPVAAMDAYANTVWSEDYTPYGERRVNAINAGDNHAWFTGGAQNEDSGLVALGNRYYDPAIGRFLSIDPVGVAADDGGNFNRYWYANNNPHKFVDPNGLWALSVDLGVIGFTIDVTTNFKWEFRAGLVGAGITLDPEDRPSRGPGLIGDCMACDESRHSEGVDIGIGFDANLGIIDGGFYKQVATDRIDKVTHSDGSESYYGYKKTFLDEHGVLTQDGRIGYDLGQADAANDRRNKGYGLGLQLDAHLTWSSEKGWSSVQAAGVTPLRDPDF